MLYVDDPSELYPGGLTAASIALSCILNKGSVSGKLIFIAVGWHTQSQHRLLSLPRRQITILWSHGIGSFAFYRSRPILSLLRAAIRLKDLIGIVSVLLRVSCIVVAYDRRSFYDLRSVDALIARMLRRPIYIIPNPIDTSLWNPGSRSSHVSLNEPAPCILSVGRAEWQKGHMAAVKLITLVRSSATIHIVAPSSTPYCKVLQRTASDLGIDNRVFLYIGLSLEQRRLKYQMATCLLCWSETEYQSLVILEALACGCPVIARPRAWLRNRDIPGVLIAYSLQEASELVDKLSTDLDYHQRLSLAGRQYVVDNHSLPVISDMWYELERDLISNA